MDARQKSEDVFSKLALQWVTIENQQSQFYVVNNQSSTCWFKKKVLVHFGLQGSTLPLTGPLKWGTVPSTSTGSGITKGQSWKHVIHLVNLQVSFLSFCDSCAK